MQSFEEGYTRTMKLAGLADILIAPLSLPFSVARAVRGLPGYINMKRQGRKVRGDAEALAEKWNTPGILEQLENDRPRVDTWNDALRQRQIKLDTAVPYDDPARAPLEAAAEEAYQQYRREAIDINKRLKEVARSDAALYPYAIKNLAHDAAATAGMAGAGLGAKSLYDKVSGD